MASRKKGSATRARTKRADLPPAKQRLYDRWLAAVHLNGGEGMRGGRQLLGAYGATKDLAEQLIYRDRKPRPRDIRDLADAAGLPPQWFTEPDWSKLIRYDLETEAEAAAERLRLGLGREPRS